MPRIRTIKPEFWTSEQVLECSTNARLLFIGLLNFCDDAGRGKVSPKSIKAQIFPSDDVTADSILGMLHELSRNDLIAFYVHDEQQFFYVTGWHHQRIDKPQPPKYPDPFHEHSKIIRGTFPPDSKGKERKGKEGKGKEDSSSTALTASAHDGFDEWWKLYPRKVGKGEARKAYVKALKTTSRETLTAGLEAFILAEPWRGEIQYCPHASKWLNQGYWENEYQAPGLAIDEAILAAARQADQEDENAEQQGNGSNLRLVEAPSEFRLADGEE